MADVTAHAKGMAKQAATLLKGQTGIYATLAKEHGEVSSLLKQAVQSESPAKREPILAKIRVELLSHARAEEKTLYNALGTLDATRDKAAHSKIEHDEIEALLQQVAISAPGTREETAALEKLRQHVEHHAQEEEQQLFVQAHDLLPKEVESRLDQEFKREKEAEKRRLEANGSGWARGPVH